MTHMLRLQMKCHGGAVGVEPLSVQEAGVLVTGGLDMVVSGCLARLPLRTCAFAPTIPDPRLSREPSLTRYITGGL